MSPQLSSGLYIGLLVSKSKFNSSSAWTLEEIEASVCMHLYNQLPILLPLKNTRRYFFAFKLTFMDYSVCFALQKQVLHKVVCNLN